MLEVWAWQHVYANVEKDQSPQGRGGFQTLFYSRQGLTAQEVEAIEARLSYFPAQGNPEKRVFFTTERGNIVVGQIVYLPEADSAGRGGRYLAHSLVFTAENFASISGDPFQVFRAFGFATTVPQALALGDTVTGDAPRVRVVLRDCPADFEPAQDISFAELRKLVLLALRANQLAQERRSLVVVGPPEAVTKTLAAAFSLVPTPLRPRCSFDTHFHKCNFAAGYFWAVGLPEAPANPALIVVDGRSGQVLDHVEDTPANAYERWALANANAEHLPTAVRHRDHAFAVCQWLVGAPSAPALLGPPPGEVVEAVFDLNGELVQDALRTRLNHSLPAALANRVLAPLLRETSPSELLQRLQTGFELYELQERLYRTYAVEQFRTPPRPEQEALEAVLSQTDHLGLRLLHSCWTAKREQLRMTLAELEEPEYREFVAALLGSGIVNPFWLLIPGRGGAFLDIYLGSTTTPERVAALAEALVVNEEIGCLARLTPYLRGMSPDEVRMVQRVVSRHPEAPEAFRQALSASLAGQTRGLRGILRWLWRGQHGKERNPRREARRE